MRTSNIDTNTKYKAKISFDDFSNVNDILVSYYLPIIKSEAYSLYSALSIDARNPVLSISYVEIERIVSMINLSVEKIKKAISTLEIVNLIEVLQDGDKIIFNLIKPLSPQDFNSSEQFSILLKSAAGEENLTLNNKLFNSMREIDVYTRGSSSSAVDLSPKQEEANTSLNVDFDFTTVKNILNAKNIDWSIYWSQKLEEQLLNLIVIYKISTFDLAVEIISEIEDGKFSIANLVDRIKRDFIMESDLTSIIESGDNTTETKLDYLGNISIRDFYLNKFNRIPSPIDEEHLTKLRTKYNLSDHKIIILLDYSTLINDGAVVFEYLFKVAETIIKENLDSPQLIIEHLRRAYKIRQKTNKEDLYKLNKPMEDVPEF